MNGVSREETRAKGTMILAMAIFATIGIFRRYIPLSSTILALSRSIIGTLFLVILITVRRKRIAVSEVRKNLPGLLLSGVLLGFNWIMLFEAYRYTSVATATLCYYMAPVFVILVSPLLFRERLTVKKILCVVVALAGMVAVSGVLEADFSGVSELKGVLLGLAAAVLYAVIVLCNKKMSDLASFDKTIMQLGVSAVVMLVYTFITEDLAAVTLTPKLIALLLVVGVVHTGVAYALYFGSIKSLKAQTVALFSYIDPIGAVFLSAVVLKETMTLPAVIGAVLVLGAMIVSELPERKERKSV